MSTGFARYPRLAFAAIVFAVGIGVCLAISTKPAPARAAQKDKEGYTGPLSVVDPACDYLKGSLPTDATAGAINSDILGCRACHSGADTPGAKPFIDAMKSDEFIMLNESVTWDEKDIHAAAMKCLTNPLGVQMEKVLSKYRPAGYKVAEAPECLTCHGADLSPQKALAEKKYDDFDVAPGGVTCTVCHGTRQRWQVEHFARPKGKDTNPPWRGLPPETKFSRGMHDLRNPVVKAALCASCHVGNAAEGKVVTHEIYAAGHPPLPPFELASYMEGEPRHWGFPTELDYFKGVKAEDTWKKFHFHPAKAESYLSRNYAVGAVVGLRAEAELLVADAERATKAGEPLDFARFDCYSCHHELLPGSDRQKRGYDGAPGRPPLRAAAGVPAGLVAKHAEGVTAGGLKDKAAGFDAKWVALKKAALDKPFGNAGLIVKDGRAVQDWCNEFLRVQSGAAEPLYTPDEATKLRKILHDTALGVTATADPEAAMSLMWAARTLAIEANPDDSKKDPKKYEKLFPVLPLNVRMPPYSMTSGKSTVPVQAQYPDRMKKVGDFTTKNFVDAFTGVFGKK